MTENHDFKTPGKGTTEWHTPLNDNFRKLDSRVPTVDFEGELGTYLPRDGAVFISKDTGTRYLGDGSQWNELPYPSLSNTDGEDTTESSSELISDFESSDVSAWSGDTGQVSFDSRSLTGSQSITATDGSAMIYSLPGDGLPAYFPEGKTASFLINSGEVGDVERFKTTFGVRDSSNFYVCSCGFAEGFFTLRKLKSGTLSSPLEYVSLSAMSDTWYSLEIDRVSGGEITATLTEDPLGTPTEVASYSHTDTDFSSESGIGFEFDNVNAVGPALDEITVV